MRRSVVGVTVGVVLVGVLSSAGGGSASRGVDATALPAGEIVFSQTADAFRDLPSSVYVMSLEGSHVRLLAKNASEPAVSRNGRQIGFLRDGAIWVMRRDGSAKRQVIKPKTAAFDLAWSADGTTIYFTASGLFTIRSDGTHLRELRPQKYVERTADPAPSPDGRIIVYTVVPDDPPLVHLTSLHAVTPAGRPARLPFRLPAVGNGGPEDAAWVPNGQRIAYSVHDDMDSGDLGATGIYVASKGSSPPRRIVSGKKIAGFPVAPWDPAWSTDGAWIACMVQSSSNNYDIWLVRPNGTGFRQITKTKADEDSPAWLPPA